MRRPLLLLGAIAAGGIAVVGSLTILLVLLEIYLTRKLHPAPNEAIGFDPVSLLGRHYQIVLPAIAIGIFVLGFTGGYCFLRKRIPG
jgi:hypothetical protein